MARARRSAGPAAAQPSAAGSPPTTQALVDTRADTGPRSRPPEWRSRLRWLLLALVPSSLMLSVTTYITTDIAAIPLLWVIPLGIYLLTFTLAFARHQWLPRHFMIRWMPLEFA